MNLLFNAPKKILVKWAPEVGFLKKKILKKCPDQNLTKGKIVLELVKYAKSALRKFRPIRGLHSGHVTFKEGF